MAIRMERSDAVATIVIDRPEARNAVDGPAARALTEAFREFEADDSLRVAVLAAITTVWKISIHCAVACGSVTILGLMYGPRVIP